MSLKWVLGRRLNYKWPLIKEMGMTVLTLKRNYCDSIISAAFPSQAGLCTILP